MTAKVYRGKITVRDYGESSDNLFIDDDEEPLADRIQEEIELQGQYLSVMYWITDEPHEREELVEEWLKQAMGASDVKWRVHWSDVTGYLWTDEEINVGGHDLLAELVSHAGKFVYLEIAYFKEPQ